MRAFGKLYAVSGAPGAGKTTVVPELVRRSTHNVVMDIDELLQDDALLGMPIATPDAAAIWPAYGRMWRRIIDMTRRSGHDVIWLTPSVPSEFEGATAWALLDCSDDVRLRRLKERNWNSDRVDYAMADAEEYRNTLASEFSTVIRTDDAEPAEVADRILQWAS